MRQLSPSPLLIGRESELARLVYLLEQGTRVTTVVGPAGVGKTFLVRRLFETLDRPRTWLGPDDLADPESTLAVLRYGLTLGRVRDPVDPPLSTVVVLDGAERLRDRLATFAAALEGLPAVLICTAPQPLGLEGEELVELAPLRVDGGADSPAARLFRSRLRQLGLEPDRDEEFQAIDDICTAIGGLPLAVELAASWVPTVGLEALRQWCRDLGERSDLESFLGLHPTLKDALQWSWDHLTPQLRRDLARLSILAPAFEVHLAAAVLERPLDQAAASLAELVRRGLLETRSDDQSVSRYCHYSPFRMTWLQRLRESQEEEDAAWAALSEHLLGAERRCEDPGSATMADWPHLQALLRHGLQSAQQPEGRETAVLCLYRCFDLELDFGELEARKAQLDTVLAADPHLRPDIALRARLMRGAIRRMAGEARPALDELCQVVAGFRMLDLPALEQRALGQAAIAAMDQRDFEEFSRLAQRGLDLAKLLGSESLLARALQRAAMAHWVQGEHDRARTCLAEGRSMRGQSAVVRCGHLVLMAAIDHDEGQLLAARTRLERALGELPRCGPQAQGASALLGTVLIELGEPRAALDLLTEPAGPTPRATPKRQQAMYLATLGVARARLGQQAAAEAVFATAEELLTDSSDESDRLRLALLRAAADPTPRPGPRARRAAALQAVASRPGMDRLPELRAAVRLVERLQQDPAPPLRIGPDARWFALGDGDPVDLGRRRSMRLILHRLAREHQDNPGRPTDRQALFAEGWPGVQISHHSAMHRLTVAISSLRKLGLGDLVQFEEPGYRIDPGAPLVMAED